MKTAAKWILGIMAVLVLLVVVAGVIIYTFDWNRAKPRINNMVSEATGRTFEIRGDLDVDWQRDPLAEGMWRRLVPLPVIKANDVILGNPEWAEHDLMAAVRETSFGVELLPLIGRVVVLRSLSVQGAEIAIERGKDRNNWTFDKPDDPQPEKQSDPWQVAVSEVLLSQGKVAYRDEPLELSLDADITSLTGPLHRLDGKPASELATPRDAAPGAAPGATGSKVPAVESAGTSESTSASTPGEAAGKGAAASNASVEAPAAANPGGYGMAFEFRGKYRDADIEGSGKTGEMLSLRDPQVRFPVQLDVRAGKVQAQAEGRVGNLYQHPELDLQVHLAAPSMALLYSLTGIVLPNTNPFETRGHLTGNLDPENSVWKYQDFTGTVGKSDLQGSLEYKGAGARPSLTGDMKSKLLQFEDLGPLIGVGGAPADPAAKEKSAKQGKAKSNKRPGRVLPDSEFITDRWKAMDLDIQFTGERIIQDAELPLDNFRTHAVMSNGVLKLIPLEFGIAQGNLKADITVDGSTKPMNARLIANVRGVQLPKLFPTVEAMQRSAGRIDGAVALVSRGNSIAELLAEGGGEIKVYLQSGRISRFLLEAASLNIASAVVAKLFGDDEVRIRCAGVSMALKDGLATMRDFRISTDNALIDVTGAIDFAEERLALDVKPESHELRLISLRTPLYVNGTFANPDIGLEKGPLLLRAGAAAALIAIAPAAAALLPLTVPGNDKETDCGELLREARSKPTTSPDTSSPIDDKSVPEPKQSRRDGPASRQTAGGSKPNDTDTQRFGSGAGAPASTLSPR